MIDSSSDNAARKLRVVRRNSLTGAAVVGLGYWGPNWVRNFQATGTCEKVVACDSDEGRRDRVKRLYPSVSIVPNFDDLIADPSIEAVVVATPVRTHYALAKRCLEAGKSVLVEKPMAMSSRESSDLIRLARKGGLVLMVGHTFEYSESVLKIRDLVENDELGEVFYVSATRTNLGLIQQDINVVWDLAPHDLSIIFAILGHAPESVACHGRCHYNPGIEDVALLTLNFSNNVVAFVHVSWLDPNKTRRITVVGSRKMLVYDDTSPLEPLKIYDKGVTVQAQYETFGEFHFAYRYGDILIPRVAQTEPLKTEAQHFIDSILTGTRPRSDGTSGLRVVSVLEAASTSMQMGGNMVAVKYGDA
jgi:predicted dehydrogenase